MGTGQFVKICLKTHYWIFGLCKSFIKQWMNKRMNECLQVMFRKEEFKSP